MVVLEGLGADASLSDVSVLAPVAVGNHTAQFFCGDRGCPSARTSYGKHRR